MGWLIVGLGGFVGAVARHAVNLALRSFGLRIAATLVVNVVGCFALGYFSTWALAKSELSPHLRLFVAVGLLGAFTTYSAFGAETFELLRAGAVGRALGWIALHLTLGLGAIWLGFRAAS